MPGSRSPARVPITRPSSGRQPHRRVDRAAAPDRRRGRAVAEVQHDQRRAVRRRVEQPRGLGGDVLVADPVRAVPAGPPRARAATGPRRTSPRPAAGRRRTRCRRPRPAAGPGTPRGRCGCRRPPAGCAAGRAGRGARSRRGPSSSTRRARVRRGPPWTTRCPTAHEVGLADPGPVEGVVHRRQRGPVVVGVEVLGRRHPTGPRGSAGPTRCRSARRCPCTGAAPEAGSTTWYFSDEEPALSTSTCRRIAVPPSSVSAPHRRASDGQAADGLGCADSAFQTCGCGTARTLPAQGRDRARRAAVRTPRTAMAGATAQPRAAGRRRARARAASPTSRRTASSRIAAPAGGRGSPRSGRTPMPALPAGLSSRPTAEGGGDDGRVVPQHHRHHQRHEAPGDRRSSAGRWRTARSAAGAASAPRMPADPGRGLDQADLRRGGSRPGSAAGSPRRTAR